MLLVDTLEGRIVDDKELKRNTAAKHDFASWVESNVLRIDAIVKRAKCSNTSIEPVLDNTTQSGPETPHIQIR
jgi:glutamate synthase (NADPH/NADH)